MSKITELYDAMAGMIQVQLPDHRRLANPYKPEENPGITLEQGWGLTIGEGLNTNRLLTSKLSIRRIMGVVVTRRYFATENDQAKKAETEKQLAEDMLLLIEDLNENRTLGGVTVDVAFSSDQGIEYVSTATDRFLMMRADFEVQYFEPIDC